MHQDAKKITWGEAVAEIMRKYKGAWEKMGQTEDIERWKRTNQYRREMRQGLHRATKTCTNCSGSGFLPTKHGDVKCPFCEQGQVKI